MSVIADSTPLIHTASIGDLNLLQELFPSVYVPLAVWNEVVRNPRLPGATEVHQATGSWIRVVRVQSQMRVDNLIRDQELDAGEAEAIALLEEQGAHLLLADDRRAVEVARDLGYEVLRTPGIYKLAKEAGLVSEGRPRLDRLRETGFWLSKRAYYSVLRDVGEEPTPEA